MDVKNLLSNDQAAEFLKVSRQWFYQLRKFHAVSPVKEYGKTKLYSMADLNKIKRRMAQ